MTHFSVPASEYMSSPILTIGADESALTAEATIEDKGVTALGVTDDNGKLVGVISRTDLLRAASGESGATFSVPDLPVKQLMSKDPLTFDVQASLTQVAKAMLSHRFHRVFITRGEGASQEVIGVVSTRDLMRAVYDQRLRAPAHEIASKSVMRVKAEDSVALAVERLDASNRHGLIVTDEGWPVGTFSQLDALLARAHDPRTRVDEVMESRILALPHEIPLYRAARQALALNVRRFVLLDEDRVVGVVSSFDFCRVMA